MLEKVRSNADIAPSDEELLGPPKIDIAGVGMMFFVSIVVGFISSIGVVIFAFLSFGNFSLGSGISPILLAMITFFALTASNMIYLWSARGIFPHVYTGSRTIFIHTTVFSIILYLSVAPLHMIVGNMIVDGSGILIAYITHVLLNIFGLEIIINILSGYRYSLLSIYASIVSLIITGSLLFMIYLQVHSESSNALFVLLGLAMLAYVVNILTSFLIRFGYYQFYTVSGYDPIGDVFARIEKESKSDEKELENRLLKK